MQQIEITDRYFMHASGGVNLSSFAMKQLGWVPGEVSVEQYIDEPGKRLFVFRYQGEYTVPDGLTPLLRFYPLSKKGYMTIDLAVRRKFGWVPGVTFKQTLDTDNNAVIIEISKEE